MQRSEALRAPSSPKMVMPLAPPPTVTTCSAWLILVEVLALRRSRSPGSCARGMHNAVRARGVACARAARGLGQGPEAAPAAWETHPDVRSRGVPQPRGLHEFEASRRPRSTCSPRVLRVRAGAGRRAGEVTAAAAAAAARRGRCARSWATRGTGGAAERAPA